MQYIILLLISISYNANACLNLYAVDSSGNIHHINHNPFMIGKSDTFFIKQQLKESERIVKQTSKSDSLYFQKLSDYATWLTKAGHYDKSLEIFQNLQLKYPNEYTINANLGTVYELTGKNDSALKYIKKSLLINPNSHYGSEWLHIRILEAKLNPTIVIEDIKFTDNIKLDKNGMCEERICQVYHQLKERVPFSKTGDKFVSKILEELGDIFYTNYSVKYGLYYYTIAYEFGLQYSTLLSQKIEKARIASKKAQQNATEKRIRKYGLMPIDEEIEKQRLFAKSNIPVLVKSIVILDKIYWEN